MKTGYVLTAMMLAGLFTQLTACEKKPEEQVSFSSQIHPIIEANCIKCHHPGGEGYEASGLNMQTYDGLMKGTKFGPVIKPGDAVSSTLIILINGRADPSINMPHGNNKPLSKEQIKLFEQWVNQGAKNN